ncbi:MAG: hypothetical protein COV72_07255 [Candidatus Omnitrophica bacterium CG11_big_fil_rev_8_21_14_0_20_42_13]|uniref:Septum formation initiator n=1 Tax=Candidatus Ghiorseimicrobium undicola TaxID=1974746 RepID=A0A2H0LY95_9BACT|nr:MAG: hypothetical protein COV72_07255 [Candidatus Omnitrophica bacterium CG11_big_fil_rev_8_21_14_0_20_42_13]
MVKVKKIIVFPAAAIFLLFIFFPAFSKIQEIKQETRELNERIENIKKENSLLEEEAKKLTSDDFYIEKVAREKMGITKKGETIYKVLPED